MPRNYFRINGARCPIKPSYYFIQMKMDLNTYAQKDVLDDLLDELLDVNNRIMARNTKEPLDWSYDVGIPANGTKCKNRGPKLLVLTLSYTQLHWLYGLEIGKKYFN